jgi:hypothetical protein
MQRSEEVRVSDRFRSAVAGLTALALVGLPAPYAFAQGTSTQAEILFRQAQEIMKKPNASQDEVHAACLKYKDSYKLDAALNTLVALAACHEKEGKTATAWGEYTDAAGQSGPAAGYAKDRAAALEKAGFLKLVVQLSPVPNGTTATLDGEPFATSAMNSETPADPGDHELTVTSPGKKTFTAKFNLSKGSSPLKVPVALVDAPPDQPPGPVAPVIINQPEDKYETNPVRTVGWVVGGVGAAGLVAGGIMGILAMVNEANRATQATDCEAGSQSACAEAATSSSRGKAFQGAAIAAAAIGGAAVITGIILIVVGKPIKVEDKKTGLAVQPSLGPGYFGLAGQF